jgi:transcriptional regulator with XRE-family HTH domain
MTFRELREQRRLNRRQLEKLAGVADGTVGKIEQGKIVHLTYHTVEKLAVALNLTVQQVAAAIDASHTESAA